MSAKRLLSGFNFRGLGRLFYVVSPAETSFEKIEDVPPFIDEAIPWFLTFLLLENVIYFLKHRRMLYRVNDTITSMGSGLLQTFVNKTVFRSFELGAYIWVYNRVNFIHLPWNSIWTWWFAFIGVDLGYYWFHRMAHEVSLFWSFHQVHHSSEDYNLSTALRQSVLQAYSSFIFYLPLAVFVPPAVFIAHLAFNVLYQFWIHTELIDSLGPLEYVINTPSHHRVHHGRNPYCIDKNYGGTLIIWDRLFGTFGAERRDEKVAYGLVHNVNTFDALYIQFFDLKWVVWDKLKTLTNLSDRIKSILYNPGWEPGKPRCTLIEDIPEVENPIVRHHSYTPWWLSAYVVVHFAVTLLVYSFCSENRHAMTPFEVLKFVVFIVGTIQNFGFFFDNRPFANITELLRCAAVTVYFLWFSNQNFAAWGAVVILFVVSLFLWITNVIFGLPSLSKPMKSDSSGIELKED